MKSDGDWKVELCQWHDASGVVVELHRKSRQETFCIVRPRKWQTQQKFIERIHAALKSASREAQRRNDSLRDVERWYPDRYIADRIYGMVVLRCYQSEMPGNVPRQAVSTPDACVGGSIPPPGV